MMPATLTDWLAHCERLHPQTIDLTLARALAMRDRLGLDFAMPLVIVGGTNGKGSTCALLEAIALKAGWRVGLHTSPHLVNFEERCRIGGRSVGADELLPHFEAVEAARGDLALTFFEFTLFVFARLFAQTPLDLVVLEVGLGGRLDAVNAFDADCAVVTSVDLDHQAWLGETREAIGFEKAGILRAGRPAVVSDPLPPQSLLDHAEALGADLWRLGRDFHYSGDRQQWNWAGRSRRYSGLAYPALRGVNQLLNAAGALAVFEALQQRLPVSAQAVRGGLAAVDLPGRFQIVPGQPTLVLDVAHNPHAVAALAENLDRMGFHPRTHAVFGAMRDKDIAAMLARIAPLVDEWHVTDLPTPRAASADELAAACEAAMAALPPLPAGVAPRRVWRHVDPAAALAAATAQADPPDRIVVFGSFHTVGGMLQHGVPRMPARHLS